MPSACCASRNTAEYYTTDASDAKSVLVLNSTETVLQCTVLNSTETVLQACAPGLFGDLGRLDIDHAERPVRRARVGGGEDARLLVARGARLAPALRLLNANQHSVCAV